MKRPRNPYRRPDAFTKAAKAQGYPARSVFKLEEIDRRTRLFRSGQRVLDLGAAPGSWFRPAGWNAVKPAAHAAAAGGAIGSLSSRAALPQKIASRSGAGRSRSLISLMARGLSEVSGGASLP